MFTILDKKKQHPLSLHKKKKEKFLDKKNVKDKFSRFFNWVSKFAPRYIHLIPLDKLIELQKKGVIVMGN